jgi:hypothetical protein
MKGASNKGRGKREFSGPWERVPFIKTWRLKRRVRVTVRSSQFVVRGKVGCFRKYIYSLYKPHGDLPLLSCNMRFNRSTDPHVPHGPRAHQPRGCHRCWSDDPAVSSPTAPTTPAAFFSGLASQCPVCISSLALRPDGSVACFRPSLAIPESSFARDPRL